MEPKNRILGVGRALASLVLAGGKALWPAVPIEPPVGINVLLNSPVSDGAPAALEPYGRVLDVIAEIHAVTMLARASDLSAIQGLDCVAAANPDSERSLLSSPAPIASRFADGENLWHLDAINVTDFGTSRTTSYDGDGVYVAVVDSGLQHNWRDYFPEERIATQHARAFEGGAGEPGTVSSQPDRWERDTFGHGTQVTSALLGFSYYGTQVFDGAAPGATIIPVKVFHEHNYVAYSTLTHAIIYVANVKATGILGSVPLVLNLSLGSLVPDAMSRAALGFAIEHGVIVVVAAGNAAELGMNYPAAFAEVISVGASGWTRQFPPDDPTQIWWMLRDVAEDDPLEHFIAPVSSWELPGQDLDVVAPGFAVPTAYTRAGLADYTFWGGTSASSPLVAGVVALMLQNNPGLGQAQVEEILESSAAPLAAGCRDVILPVVGPGNEPTWSDEGNVSFFGATICWDSTVTGHGLVQADAALAATPLP